MHPKENVEVKVGEVARHLFGPVLLEPVLQVCDAQGKPTSLRIREQEPAVLGDLYAGDQLLVAARYVGSEPILFRLTGREAGGEHVSEHLFDPATASRERSFVPRLWASRRIGTLVDEVRQSGADAAQAAADPKLDELVQEIVALSTEFGILTEYTAFMATEGSQLFDPGRLRQRTRKLLSSRAQQVRTGRGAVSQAVNLSRMRRGGKVDRLNSYLDGNLKDIEVSAITYVGDLAFFHSGDRWIDSRLISLVHQAQAAAGSAVVAAAVASTPPAPGTASAPGTPSPSGTPSSSGTASAPSTSAPGTPPSPDTPAAPVATPGAQDPLKTAARIVDFGTPEYFQLSRQLAAQGRAGMLALPGPVVTLVDGQRVLIQPPHAPKPAPAPPAKQPPG